MTLVGSNVGLSRFGVVTLATVTAGGGGSIANVLLGRVPVALGEDFDATPALVGESCSGRPLRSTSL